MADVFVFNGTLSHFDGLLDAVGGMVHLHLFLFAIDHLLAIELLDLALLGFDFMLEILDLLVLAHDDPLQLFDLLLAVGLAVGLFLFLDFLYGFDIQG